jgi:hypothetical protein
MRPDDQIPTRLKKLMEVGQDLALGLFDEVGECKVAAEDQVEGAFGHFVAEVLEHEIDVLAVGILELQLILAELVECGIADFKGHVFGAADRVDGGVGTGELMLTGVCSKDPESGLSEARVFREAMQNGDGVGLLSGTATRTPDVDDR